MKKLVSLFLALIMMLALVPSVTAEEPVKITYGSTQSVADFAQFEIIQELCKKLNIELTVTNYDYDSLLVMLADGSFPDIMASRIEYRDNVRKSGYALNIEP